jgi:hypothetical protein
MRPSDIIEPRYLEFIAEKIEGPPERELKQMLVPILKEAGVKSAYLAIADYHDGTPPSVVLCLRSEKVDDAVLAYRIGQVFAGLFNSEEHLDVLFMDSPKESAVRAICTAFYVRDSYSPPPPIKKNRSRVRDLIARLTKMIRF